MNISKCRSSVVVRVNTTSKNGVSYKRPGPKTPPDFISERAKAEWPVFYKKYGSLIRENYNDDLKMKWSFIKVIFTNYCYKRNIPFEDPSTSHLDHGVAKSLQQRFLNNRNKLTDKTEVVLKYFFEKELITRVFKERIDAIYYDEKRSMWRMISTIPVKLMKEVSWNSNDMKSIFKSKGFKLRNNKYEYTLGTQKIQIIDGDDDNPTKMYIRTILSFTPQHLRYIFRLSDKELKDSKNINKMLKLEFKKLLDKNPISKITAKLNSLGYDPNTELYARGRVNFNKALSGEEKRSLYAEKIRLTDSKLSDIAIKYDLPYIRSLFGPTYQLELVRLLLRVFKDKKIPDLWVNIIKNPQKYLNPYLKEV